MNATSVRARRHDHRAFRQDGPYAAFLLGTLSRPAEWRRLGELGRLLAEEKER
jgi:hypothetical protein